MHESLSIWEQLPLNQRKQLQDIMRNTVKRRQEEADKAEKPTNKRFQELKGVETELPPKRQRLSDKYGLFNPLEICIECFQNILDAEKYIKHLEKRGKYGYTIRMMRASEPFPHQQVETPVTLKWFPEVDENNRVNYYQPYMTRKLHVDLTPTLDTADSLLLVSPYV